MTEEIKSSPEELGVDNLTLLTQKLSRADFDQDEWKLIEAIDLGRIDLSVPENSFQFQLVEGLLSRYDHQSLFKRVIEQLGMGKSPLEKVEFQKLRLDDLGNRLGTKREVDLVRLILQNGEELKFTASIDIEALYEDEESPSEREVKNLGLMNGKSVESVQRLYASRRMKVDDEYAEDPKTKTLICKEYLPGRMLEMYLVDPEYTVQQIGEENFRYVAYLTGYAMQEPVTKSGFAVKDSNPLNFIVGQHGGKPFVRYCDEDTITDNPREISLEFRLMRSRFGKYATDFDEGMNDAKAGKERK